MTDNGPVKGIPGVILSIQELASCVRSARAAGEVVVLCHGCFDIVHPGHVRHLQQAAKLGVRLVVTVTGDRDVGKGFDRPLIPQELRAENLAALDVVDWVAISPHPTAAEMLEEVRPDIYVKGREYETNDDPRFAEEKRIVHAHGGRVVFTSGDIIFSSTALIGAMERGSSPVHAAVHRVIQNHQIDAAEVESIVEGMRGRRVLVVGETIIDTYVHCDQPEVASEGPMMTLRPVERRSFDGGAAIVARHLAAMGARPVLVTALPRTLESEALRLRLEVEGVELAALDVDQQLIEKQRFLVGTTKVMKLDTGERLVLDDQAQNTLLALALHHAPECEAMIVADFGLGLLSARTLTQLAERVRPHVNVMTGDVSGRRSNLTSMQAFDFLTPSETELRHAINRHDDGLAAAVWGLMDRTSSRGTIVTLGAEGLVAFSRRDVPQDSWNSLQAEHIPSLVGHAVDAMGCGDALLAASTLVHLLGRPIGLAALVGSVAAAIEARRLGNAVVSASDLRRELLGLLESRLTFDPPAAAAPRIES